MLGGGGERGKWAKGKHVRQCSRFAPVPVITPVICATCTPLGERKAFAEQRDDDYAKEGKKNRAGKLNISCSFAGTVASATSIFLTQLAFCVPPSPPLSSFLFTFQKIQNLFRDPLTRQQTRRRGCIFRIIEIFVATEQREYLVLRC